MYKKLLLCFALLGFLSSTSYASKEDINQLINGHINAAGGKEALRSLQSVTRFGSITFFNANPQRPIDTYCYRTNLVFPNKLREQIKGSQIVYDRGTDGVSFWSWDGNQFSQPNDEKTINYLKETAEQANRDILYIKTKYHDFKSLEQAPDWAPLQSRCMQATSIKKQKITTFCFDEYSKLLNAIGNVQEYRLFDDYRQLGAVALPLHIIHYQHGLIAYEIQLSQVEIDALIPDLQFQIPSVESLTCDE